MKLRSTRRLARGAASAGLSVRRGWGLAAGRRARRAASAGSPILIFLERQRCSFKHGAQGKAGLHVQYAGQARHILAVDAGKIIRVARHYL